MAPAEHCGRHDAHRPLPSTRAPEGGPHHPTRWASSTYTPPRALPTPQSTTLVRLQYSVEPITSKPLVPIEARENAGVPSADRERSAKGILEHTAAAVLPDCASGRRMFLPRRLERLFGTPKKGLIDRRVLNRRRLYLGQHNLDHNNINNNPQQQQQQNLQDGWPPDPRSPHGLETREPCR